MQEHHWPWLKTLTEREIPSRAVMAEAAVWLAHICSDECDDDGFRCWFEESKSHREAFAKVLGAWALVGELKNSFPDFLAHDLELGPFGSPSNVPEA